MRLLQGDCRVRLPTLPERSVQAACSSPPYWGLRSYGTPDLVWGGDVDCEHDWRAAHSAGWHVGSKAGIATSTLNNSAATHQANNKVTGMSMGRTCVCGAWLGSLGLEPTPDLFIEHLVECFRPVRRVLKDDGVVWLNLGDSYAGSGKGPTGWNGIGNQARRQGFAGGPDLRAKRSERPQEGTKPKDLLMIPARVAMALQADGWWLRSMIPWLKRNSMPESVQDRPASAVEYVFLLSKSRTYYWDADAIRAEQSANTHARGNGHTPKERPMGEGVKANASFHAATNGQWLPNGRNRRNTDWFFESWQGLLADEQAEPLAFVVNPAPYKGAHYATFPPKLVEPMILASTSEKGECPECGKAWVRMTETSYTDAHRGMVGNQRKRVTDSLVMHAGREDDKRMDKHSKTLGWAPQCEHDAEPVPQTVLDPFAGACTTLMVADRLGRDAIGCELSSDYSDQGFSRARDDAPLFFDGAMA